MTLPPLTHRTLDSLASSSFCRVADARQFDGNAVRVLFDGPQNYAAWLSAIAAAERTVHLENYLLQGDATGQTFADALISAARRGVKCRVLYDWLGCRSKTPQRFWAALRQGGVEVRCYNPPQADNLLRWVSRNHRKVLTVDSRIGYTGGLCIGQNWAGYPSRGIPPWRDTAIEIKGPAAAYLSQAFADSWATAGPPIDDQDLPPCEIVEPQGPFRLWVIAGLPDAMGLYRLEQLVAEIVEQSLWLADAYFVATTGYVRALTGAARAGVDVRLLVPSAGDLPIVRAISRSAYRPLLEAGVRVFEWNGPMMHAKTAVADGCWSRIGSSNSNLASWISNRELDVTIHDPGFASTMAAMYERDLENATEIVLRSGRIGRSGSAKSGSTAADGTGARRLPSRGALPGTTSRLLAGAIGFGSAVGATLARHRVIGASESRSAFAAGVLLVGLALTALLLPSVIAYPFGVIAAWVGITFLIEAATLMAATRTPPE